MKFRDVLDGLSNTIAAGEIATDLGDQDKRTMWQPAGNPSGDESGESIGLAPLACRGRVSADRPQFWGSVVAPFAESNRGYKWSSGSTVMTQMNTILPPNSEVCLGDQSWTSSGVAPPSSRHQGGVHVLMGDGAVRFITDSIEAGNSSLPHVELGQAGARSPFGLWGALGTRAIKEVIDEDF